MIEKDITLKEYLDSQIEFINKELGYLREKIAYERELHTSTSNKIAEALELQAKEYERRLDALNGEAGRLRDMQAMYLPREVYESEKKEIEAKFTIINDWKNEQKGAQSVVLRWWSIGLIIISAVVSIILRKIFG